MFMTANEIMRNIRNIFKLSFKEAVTHEILRVKKVVSSICKLNFNNCRKPKTNRINLINQKQDE